MFKVLLLVGFAILTVCSYSIDSEYDKLVHIGEFEDSKDLDTNNLDTNSLGQVYYVTSKKGKRVFGDQLLTQSTRYAKSPNGASANIDTVMSYPPAGYSRKQITYFEVKIEQTSDWFDVSIIRGGLHQHQVTLRIQSTSTVYQKITVEIYGR